MDHQHFYIVLYAEAAKNAGEHVGIYSWKKLLQKCQSIDQLATFLGVDPAIAKDTLEKYQEFARHGNNPWGKSVFPKEPLVRKSSTRSCNSSPALLYGRIGHQLGRTSLGWKRRSDPRVICRMRSIEGVHGNN
jgi:hypothetical protein